MAGVEAPWELMGSSPERGRRRGRGTEVRGALLGEGGGSAWAAGLCASLRAFCLLGAVLFAACCAVREVGEEGEKREEKKKKEKKREKKEKIWKFFQTYKFSKNKR
jgi:hypothetical protein